MSDPRFSRHGYTGPFGKLCIDPINGLRLAEQTLSIIQVKAAEAGLPLREFIRQRLELDFHGREEVERAMTVRLDLVQGKVQK
jgi:hypothetical protein